MHVSGNMHVTCKDLWRFTDVSIVTSIFMTACIVTWIMHARNRLIASMLAWLLSLCVTLARTVHTQSEGKQGLFTLPDNQSITNNIKYFLLHETSAKSGRATWRQLWPLPQWKVTCCCLHGSQCKLAGSTIQMHSSCTARDWCERAKRRRYILY